MYLYILNISWEFKKIYNLEKKFWSFIYQNVGFGENILSLADISQRYQSGNYQLQYMKYDCYANKNSCFC